MRRALALLALSLIAGVLAAQEQSVSLRDRVRALRMEIEARSRAVRPNQVTTREYDIGTLLATVPHSTAEPRDLPLSQYQPPEAGEDLEPWPIWQRDTILELLTEAVGPDANVEMNGSVITLDGPPVIHQRVERLLKLLRERVRDRVIVEIELVSAVENAGRGDRLGHTTVRCMNAQQQAFAATREREYVFDFEEESAREAGIAKAIRGTVSEGLSGDLQICLDRKRRGVLAHMRILWQRLAGEPRSIDTQHGPIALPELDAVRLGTSTWLPFDRHVVVASCTRGMTPCHVVVRVRLAE